MSRFKNMSREEFERDHATGFRNGGLLWPWDILTWKERVVRVVIVYPVMAAVTIGGFVAILVLVGMLIDGVTQLTNEISRCQKRAVTPYDYHQCK